MADRVREDLPVRQSHQYIGEPPITYRVHESIVRIFGKNGERSEAEQAAIGGTLIAIGAEMVMDASFRSLNAAVNKALRGGRKKIGEISEAIEEMRPTENSIFGRIKKDLDRLT